MISRAAYIAEYGNNVVRLVWLNGSISTVAGNGTAGYAGQGMPAVMAMLRGPSSLAYDGLGGILVAVSSTHWISWDKLGVLVAPVLSLPPTRTP